MVSILFGRRATREHLGGPWVITVLLSPDAAEPTLPLRIALADFTFRITDVPWQRPVR